VGSESSASAGGSRPTREIQKDIIWDFVKIWSEGIAAGIGVGLVAKAGASAAAAAAGAGATAGIYDIRGAAKSIETHQTELLMASLAESADIAVASAQSMEEQAWKHAHEAAAIAEQNTGNQEVQTQLTKPCGGLGLQRRSGPRLPGIGIRQRTQVRQKNEHATLLRLIVPLKKHDRRNFVREQPETSPSERLKVVQGHPLPRQTVHRLQAMHSTVRRHKPRSTTVLR
jgi:hypothetical protein